MFHKEDLLGEDVTFLWRYLDQYENEMEGVVIARTTSFVAIGNLRFYDWGLWEKAVPFYKYNKKISVENGQVFWNIKLQNKINYIIW